MSVNLASSELWTPSEPGSNLNGRGLHGGDFVCNGDGNFREVRTDPWGNPALVWVSKNNDVTSDADGGWNKNISSIEAGRKYLSVVYFRRVSDTAAGYFYHGCSSVIWGGANSTENINGGTNDNPYFSYPLLSKLDKGIWHVSVGVIHQAGYAGTHSGLSGIYRLDTRAKILTSTEYRLTANASAQMHRTYLYYSTNPLDEVEWWNPIFCAMDGTEPSLSDLLAPPVRSAAPQSYDDWLLDPRNQRYRVTLVEIHADSGLYRMATQPYFQPDAAWDDLLIDDIIVESALDASVSVGDFSFSDDYRTHWGVEDFYGRPCRIWLGDTRWSRTAFVQIADLVIDHIQRQDDGVYRVTFTDAIPALEEKITGAIVNGQHMPVVFGSPRNVTPIMADYLTRTYRFSESALTAISAVRDRGKTPASSTKLLSTGSIKIGVNVAGTVTGDVTATPTYLRDVVAALLTRAGIATTAAGIEMRRFPTAYPNGYPLDLFIVDQPSYRDQLNTICESCGASLAREAGGTYSLTYESFDGVPVVTLTSDDILEISEESREPVYKTIVVNYAKNWTVQTASELAGGVAMSDVKKYGSEFYGTLTAQTNYSGSLHDGTLTHDILSGLPEATAEAERLAERYAKPRRRWRISATQTAIGVRVGDLVAVNDPALSGSVLVVAVSKNNTDLTTELDVIA